MKHAFIFFTLFIVLGCTQEFSDSTNANTEQTLIPQLAPFKPYINMTYRGEFTQKEGEKKMIDVSRWERHLNGTAVKITHSLNQGEYGGETIILWDEQNQQIRFFYFTTAGFYTQGWIEVDKEGFTSFEKVTGNQDGITEVKAISKLNNDGTMSTQSLYLRNGSWIDGHAATYYPAPNEKVTFK